MSNDRNAANPRTQYHGDGNKAAFGKHHVGAKTKTEANGLKQTPGNLDRINEVLP